jgi:nucleotidyltransferase substrate binding protein (TIGR01987 family)
MDNQRFIERRIELTKAAERLQDACNQPYSEFIRDAVIQRFEFCWELAWKTLKLQLAYLGIEANNPRDCFQLSLQHNLFIDGNAWSEAQRMRNLSSHTYDEALANQVYQFIQHTGLSLFLKLAEDAKTWQTLPQ